MFLNLLVYRAYNILGFTFCKESLNLLKYPVAKTIPLCNYMLVKTLYACILYMCMNVLYHINTSEIPGELSRENMISSLMKITCYFHTWKYHRCYAHLWNILQHEKRNCVSPSGHVISSMYPFTSMNYFKVHYIHVHCNINFCFISAKTWLWV